MGTDESILPETPGIPYHWSFDKDSVAPRVARRCVRSTLEVRHIPAPTVEVVELLTSELVTNALLHGGTAPDLELVVSDQTVRVGVNDHSDDPPVLCHAQPSDTTGRGIALVDQLAAVWGTEPLEGGGKQVWFEVPFTFR